METTRVSLFRRNDFGSKGLKYAVEIEIGKWYKFKLNFNRTAYGKVVTINHDGTADVEKYFELPDYRPYAIHKWYDDLNFALMTEEEEKIYED